MIPLSDDDSQRRTFPIVTIIIIAINFLVFFYELMLGPALETFFTSWAVIPAEITTGQDVGAPTIQPHILTLISSMFLHGGWLHILSNMLFLWVFGDNVEDAMGHIGYAIFYFLCGIAAGLTHILFNFTSQIPSLGASGAIAGVLAAYLMLFPRGRVNTLMTVGQRMAVQPVPAIVMIGIWIVTQFLTGIASLGAQTAQTDGVAVWAHVGGFVAGLILVWLFARGAERPHLPFGSSQAR